MITAAAITWDAMSQMYLVNSVVACASMLEVLELLSDDETPRAVPSTPVCHTNAVLLSTRWEVAA